MTDWVISKSYSSYYMALDANGNRADVSGDITCKVLDESEQATAPGGSITVSAITDSGVLHTGFFKAAFTPDATGNWVIEWAVNKANSTSFGGEVIRVYAQELDTLSPTGATVVLANGAITGATMAINNNLVTGATVAIPDGSVTGVTVTVGNINAIATAVWDISVASHTLASVFGGMLQQTAGQCATAFLAPTGATVVLPNGAVTGVAIIVATAFLAPTGATVALSNGSVTGATMVVGNVNAIATAVWDIAVASHTLASVFGGMLQQTAGQCATGFLAPTGATVVLSNGLVTGATVALTNGAITGATMAIDGTTSGLLTRILGLMHENAYVSTATFDASANMTDAIVRIYDGTANIGKVAGTGVIAAYVMAATYAGGKMATYKMTKQANDI